MGYTCKQTPNEAYEGAAILVKSTIQHEFIKNDWQFKHFLAVKLYTLHGPVIFCTAYSRPNTQIPYADLNNIFNYNNIPVYLMADLNTNHPTFNHNSSNVHGTQLHNLLTYKRLSYLGPDFPTFFSGRRQGRPDIVLSNRTANILQHYITPGPPVGSDHIPIILHISNSPIIIPNTTEKFNFKQADWDKFTDTLNNTPYTLEHDGQPISHIDTQWEHIHNSIINAANSSIPKITYTTRYSFIPSIKSQRLLICYRNRFLQNQHRIPQIHWDLTIIRNHLINSLQADHIKHWTHLIQQTEQHRTTSPSQFWNKIFRLRGTSSSKFEYLNINNRHINTPQEVADAFHNHWSTIFNPNPIHPRSQRHIQNIIDSVQSIPNHTQPSPIIDTSTLDNNHILTAPITSEETKTLLHKTPKRAPGISGISHHMTKHLPPPIINAITSLYNASLATGYFPKIFKTATTIMIPKPQKDPHNPANYRPISLLEILGKTFERINNKRLRLFLEDEDLLNDKHFGFRPLRSTQDILNITTNYLHINKHTKQKTALLTKDVQRAFDTVWHVGLKYKICNQFNLPIITQKLLCNYLDDRRTKIKFQNHFSNYFNLNAGVPQGSVLAPTLFIIFTNDLPNPIYNDTLTLQYADDVTLLTRSPTLDRLTTKTENELEQITTWEHRWRIITHPQKSLLTYFYTKNRPPRPIYPNRNLRQPIPIKTTNKVLGITYDNYLRIHTHSLQKTAIARTQLNKLYRFHSATPRTKLHLYKALIRPLISYSPLTLSLTANTNFKNLQKIQNRALRWIHNITWQDFRTSLSLHEQSNIPSLNTYHRHLIDRQLESFTEYHPQWIEKLQNLQRILRHNQTINLFNIINSPYPDPIY